MPNYFALTNYNVIDLGDFISNTEAEDYAMQQFNLNPDSHAFLVLTSEELKQLVIIANKRLDEEDTH